MKVGDYVLELLKREPQLTNMEIAERVQKELGSATTPNNISWYRWKFSTTNALPNIVLSDEDIEIATSYTDNTDEEELIFWKVAEDLIVKYEESKGAKVEKISNQNLGYDLISKYANGEERLIEVKSKKSGKKTWLEFTSNETTSLKEQANFWLYIVESHTDSSMVNITEVAQIDLLKAVKFKLRARVSNLSGYARKTFNISKTK